MIKALLVDDEYLSRKGMMLTIPWEKYGIRIIGEADCMEHAVDFLACHTVDLLLTDISMPKQTGFDLISHVVRQYPAIFIVLITCHQDFNYLQKALRMGAIDYIVKTELEQETLEECLNRITHKIRSYSGSAHNTLQLPPDTAVLLYAPSSGRPYVPQRESLVVTEQIPLDEKSLLLRMDICCAEAISAMSASHPHQIMLLAREVSAYTTSQLAELFKVYMNYQLFYQYRPNTRSYVVDPCCQLPEPSQEEAVAEHLQEEWSSLQWIYGQDLFDALKRETMTSYIKSSRLKRILYIALRELEQRTAIPLSDQLYLRLETAEFWTECETLLEDARDTLASQFNHSSYPDETFRMILASVEYIQAHFVENLNQESIARQFHLSRSYFSRAFKNIVGNSFTEYIHGLRMREAGQLLLRKNTPIFTIAYELGFCDEKYFSKSFKKYYGISPMEFRSQHHKTDACAKGKLSD